MHRMTRSKTSKFITLLIGIVLLASACETGDTGDTSQESESKSRQGTYDQLVADQPAHSMSYSPSRDTINFWIDTWGQPDKLSYVYLQSADGTLLGYYVLKGLPVSYCAALTPNYETYDVDTAEGGTNDLEVIVPAPGVDGVYYSGGQCNTYYGRDATSDAYIEYTVGMGINVLLFDAPMPRQNDAQPLGPTAVEDVQ